ncbi:MAG: AAA family ATPase [Eubacterium sp.]
MIIKTLILTSFGKFKDRIIEVDNGLNLIYGDNETGKSTVQHFIEGMFFGFYKPYRKKRTYSNEYQRFKPWNSDSYCGSMIIEDDSGKEIRIERDFLKKQDGVTIYDNVTGENITSLYKYDNVTRQSLPLGEMKINSIIYNNTVNIKQMAGESDEELAREVNDRLMDLNTEQREEVSLNRVMGYLSNKKKAIGNYGQRKSNYGLAVRELENLEKELIESEQVYNVIQKNHKRIQQYKRKIVFAQNKCQNIDEKSQEKTKQELQNMKKKVDVIQFEGKELEERLKKLEKYEIFDMRVYGRLKILQNNAEGAAERIKGLITEIEELKKKHQDVNLRCDRIKDRLKNLSRKEIQSDYQKYEYTRDHPDAIHKEQEVIQSEIFRLNRISNGLLILLMVIGAIIVLGTITNPGGLLPKVVMIFVSFVGWFIGLGAAALMIYKIKMPMSPKVTKFEESAELLTAVDSILQKYGKETTEEYEMFVFKAEEIFNRLDKLDIEKSILFGQLEEKKKELSGIEKDKQSCEKDLCEELNSVGIETVDEYNEGCQKCNEIEKVKAELTANHRLYDELSGGDLIKVNQDEKESDNPVLMVVDGGKKIHARDALMAFNQEVSRLQGENHLLVNSVDNPVEIKEKIETLKIQISEYEEDINACDMAMEIFSRLSKETHYDSAPVLNKKIGQVLQDITKKYKEVKIDDQLQIKVVNPENGELISINQLSGGTIDQIYFALRFGVGNMLSFDKILPFVLDDPFVQYDFLRKTEVVRFLCNLSAGRQVLLFTCSGDEKRILDQNELPYSGIIL